jgi:ABC-type lipoprotein release transport system permease subunit
MSRNPGGIGLILILAFGAIDAGVMAVIVAMATLAGGSR